MSDREMNDQELLLAGKSMILAEADVVTLMADNLGQDFVAAVRLVAACTGTIFVTGAGTSGTMARRLAHMLSTCGMPAFFAHPADALHGPSAAVMPGDILIAFSKAGKSAEINQFATVAHEARGEGDCHDVGAGLAAGQAQRHRAQRQFDAARRG